MARTKNKAAGENQPEQLGAVGDVCAQCGTTLAPDQRYCLNCGTPRAEPRLDFERHLAANGSDGPGQPPSQQQALRWTPVAAVVAIAILGGMLLLGVLIGQDDNEVTVTEVQQAGTTAPATTAPTTTAPPATTTAPEASTTPEAKPPATTAPPAASGTGGNGKAPAVDTGGITGTGD